jgi:hypothetical protein
LKVEIESGVVKYDATFFFDVQYSALKSLRIDVPEDLAADIRNVSTGIREATLDPQPDNVDEGYVAWSFTGESEFLGSAKIQLTWEQRTGELEVGRSRDYPMPVLKPEDVDRAWGQIVVVKAETLDVHPSEGFAGLVPRDPRHDLMPGVAVPNAARAFEFHDVWSLTLSATRYELEEVKRTSIERAVVRMVVTRSDRIAVQALYRMRSAVQRLALSLPAVAAEEVEFDTDPLRINGRPVALESGDEGQFFVPLVGQDPDKPFVLELRYTVRGTHRQLNFPVFPAQPPVQTAAALQKVFLCVYVPEELAVVGFDGPWTIEQGGWLRQQMQALSPETTKNDSEYLDRVVEGIPEAVNSAGGFATDGRLQTFSAIQPPAPPEGALHLIAVRQNWLNIAVVVGFALIGLIFVRASVGTKLVVVTLLIVALVLSGVFVPLFAARILNLTLLITLALVLLVWLVAMVPLRRPQPAATPATAPEEMPFALEPTGAEPPVQPSGPDEPPADAPSSPPADGQPPPKDESSADDAEGEDREGGQGHA